MSRLPNSNSRRVTLTAAAFARGKSLAQTSRDAAAGKLGPVTRGVQNTKLVERSAVERALGRPISDVELDAAAAAGRKKQSAALTDQEILARMDAGIAGFYAEHRDREWRLHLDALGLTPLPFPPASALVRPMLDSQWFFTRDQVETLLTTAQEQQSRRWHEWVNSDLTHQAMYPDGPETLTLKSIKE